MSKFVFKNAEVKKIWEASNKKGLKFGIPYADETTTKPQMYLVHDAGVYLCHCIIGEKPPAKNGLISYAKNHGPNTHMGGDDYIEVIPFEGLTEGIEKGYDLVINMGSSRMSIGFQKAS